LKDREIIYQEGNELYGIPITVKEFYIMKGFDSTVGCAAK
jgi:Asp-tRNA(Asn)/Glu-tRNA(Gln) amidotransferase A subunit family amidase